MTPQKANQDTRPSLEVSYHPLGIGIVKLRGEHDLSGKPALAKALDGASRQTNVLVDLSECSFIDSTIIGVLVLASKTLTDGGGRCEFIIPPEASIVHRVAHIAGLDQILVIHETHSAGIATFQPAEESA
jgi:anti-sigma B factor antagonist